VPRGPRQLAHWCPARSAPNATLHAENVAPLPPQRPQPSPPQSRSTSSGAPLLEVIATSVADGLAAASGGADRLEVVGAMEADGLLPDESIVLRLRDAVTISLRVMLRLDPGFFATPRALELLAAAAERLKRAGLNEFVFGFLTPSGALDRAAIQSLCQAVTPGRWTLHRAFDHVADPPSAFAQCGTYSGLDGILSAGSPEGIDAGLQVLQDRASWQTEHIRWLAGGGLRLDHIPLLSAAGIARFHAGRAVRFGRRWDAPIDPTGVRQLKDTIARV
jgi:copper homeostasis protein